MAATESTAGPEFTAKEVAAHREANDCWMVIHGEGKPKTPPIALPELVQRPPD